MSLPKVEEAIGWLVLPFQYAVQEPALAVWMNAKVRYFAPDCCAKVVGLSPFHASKYGAKTWVGSGVAACAAVAPVTAKASPAADAVAAAMTARTVDLRLISVPLLVRKRTTATDLPDGMRPHPVERILEAGGLTDD